MSGTIRRLVIFGAPLLVGLLNIFHPVHFEKHGIYDGLQPVAAWWITLHVFNLFGFGLLGLAAYLLLLDRHGIAATVAKCALIIFVPAYIGFDALAGIATGDLIQVARALPIAQLPALKTAIDAFWGSGIVTMLAIIGSVAWSVAMGASGVSFAQSRRAAALALAILAGAFTGWGFSAGAFGTLAWWIGLSIIAAIGLSLMRPALPYTLLILSGVLMGTSHVVPFGPLGMACFIAAAFVVEIAGSSVSIRKLIAAGSS